MSTPYEAGDPESKILILGQAPSYMEMRQKEPLVGPAGGIFNECLQKAGIRRKDCYILNIWELPVKTDKHRAGRITTANGTILSTDAGITADGWELAQPAIERINASKANVIMPMGMQAMEISTGKKKGITKWRGSVLSGTNDIHNRKVLPTIHPSAVLQGNYLWKYLIISDMQKLLAEASSPLIELPQRNIVIRPSLDQIMDAFREAEKLKLLATDVEVINRHMACFCICTTPTDGIVIPFVDDQGAIWSIEEEIEIWKAYCRVMGDASITKVNQNIIGFDAPYLLQQYNIMTRGPIGDTMAGYNILYPEFPKSLGFISSLYTREPYWKDEGKMWKNAGGSFEEFWLYNGKDGCCALECWYPIEQELRDLDMWETYEKTANKLLDPILYMSICGLNTDSSALVDAGDELDLEIEKLGIELIENSDYIFNPGSTKQCQDYFYSHKGLKPYVSHKTGSPTTDDLALSRIYRKTGMKEAKLVQEIRNKSKLRATYMEVQLDPDLRMRCSWDPRGTWTGRFSSGQTIFGTGGNLQNIDPRFKRFIVEDE